MAQPRREEQTGRGLRPLRVWSVLPLLLVLLAPAFAGCQPECHRLALTVCKDLGPGDPVCGIVREVALEDASQGERCRDLLAAWPDGGAVVLGRFRKALRDRVKRASKRGRETAKATREEIMESARRVLRKHLRGKAKAVAKAADAGRG